MNRILTSLVWVFSGNRRIYVGVLMLVLLGHVVVGMVRVYSESCLMNPLYL